MKVYKEICDFEDKKILEVNEAGKPTHIIYANCLECWLRYNLGGQLVEYWDNLGEKRRAEYDEQGRLISYSSVSGYEYEAKYSEKGKRELLKLIEI